MDPRSLEEGNVFQEQRLCVSPTVQRQDGLELQCPNKNERNKWRSFSDIFAAVIILTVLTCLNYLVGAMTTGYMKLAQEVNFITCGIYFFFWLRDPGTLPLVETSVDATRLYGSLNHTYCEKCQSFVPGSAHHCAKCDRCIDRFVHHSSLFGKCVGEANRSIYFLTFVVVFEDVLVCLVLLHFRLFPKPNLLR